LFTRSFSPETSDRLTQRVITHFGVVNQIVGDRQISQPQNGIFTPPVSRQTWANRSAKFSPNLLQPEQLLALAAKIGGKISSEFSNSCKVFSADQNSAVVMPQH